MLTPEQESSLTSSGDCFDHWHSSDRLVDHKTLLAIQDVSKVYAVSDNFTITDNQDFVIVDTTTKDVTIIMPIAVGGREIEITKLVSPFKVYVQLAGADLIYGETSVEVDIRGTSLRFKAIPGGWILI